MNVENKDGVTVARLEGSLDLAAHETLLEPLAALFDEPGAKVILDLRRVTSIDSAGWALLLSVLHRSNEKEGHLRLLNLSDQLASFFVILNLERIFQVFDDEETALRSFRVWFQESAES
jgi:anti-anti-sigma factor